MRVIKENRIDGLRVSENARRNLTKLYFIECYKINKSFGVQSQGGENGKRTSLMSWRPDQGFAGSRPVVMAESPSLAHKPNMER